MTLAGQKFQGVDSKWYFRTDGRIAVCDDGSVEIDCDNKKKKKMKNKINEE